MSTFSRRGFTFHESRLAYLSFTCIDCRNALVHKSFIALHVDQPCIPAEWLVSQKHPEPKFRCGLLSRVDMLFSRGYEDGFVILLSKKEVRSLIQLVVDSQTLTF
ncbi:unnamed protein product [Cylicocyclus nassatus]|uniref:Uncharacterized protein n=1 Tax=Cylicocyclus nassatus TaxID=53992 RepID=A0AA36HGR8_CYLNA|nr:unnamed protein product [Cylicocyclus nassatus]